MVVVIEHTGAITSMGFGREVSWISEHSIEEETTQLTQGSSRRDGWSRQLASLILDGCCATRVEQCSSFLGNLGQKEATWCRPPEAPMKVSPKISIFEGQFWSNPSPNLAYFWVKITPCFPVVSIFEGSLGLARGSSGFLRHLPIQKFWSTCNRILKNPFCL